MTRAGVLGADGYIASETVAAIVLHVRRVGPDLPPIRLSGHSTKPFAMCGSPMDWDTVSPVSERTISCRSCRIAMGWPEWMVRK